MIIVTHDIRLNIQPWFQNFLLKVIGMTSELIIPTRCNLNLIRTCSKLHSESLRVSQHIQQNELNEWNIVQWIRQLLMRLKDPGGVTCFTNQYRGFGVHLARQLRLQLSVLVPHKWCCFSCMTSIYKGYTAPPESSPTETRAIYSRCSQQNLI